MHPTQDAHTSHLRTLSKIFSSGPSFGVRRFGTFRAERAAYYTSVFGSVNTPWRKFFGDAVLPAAPGQGCLPGVRIILPPPPRWEAFSASLPGGGFPRGRGGATLGSLPCG